VAGRIRTRSNRPSSRAAAGLVAGLVVVALLASPAAASPASARDRALAQSALLQPSDFPAGWTTGPRTDNARADRIRGGIADCRRYQRLVTMLRRQPEASANFLQRSASVSSTVFVLSSARAAQSTFTQLTSPGVVGCLTHFLGVVLTQSIFIRGAPARLQGVNGAPTTVTQAGDQTTAFQFVVTLTAAGLTTPVYEQVEVARVGRAITEFGFENPSTPLPPDFRDALVNAVVGRLASAR
jgi:hypothetical protein